MLVPPAHSSRSDRRLDRKTLKKEAAGAMDEFNERWKERANTMRPQDGSNNSNQTRPDTIIIPMIQMGQLGIRQEESVLRQLLELVSRKRPGRKPWTVHLSSGYLNFPEMLLNLIIKSEALFRILTAAPEVSFCFQQQWNDWCDIERVFDRRTDSLAPRVFPDICLLHIHT